MSDNAAVALNKVLQRLTQARAAMDADERAMLDSIVLSARVSAEAESEVNVHRFADEAVEAAANPKIFKVELEKETYKVF